VAQPAFGLLVPASNRVMEQDFIRWLPAGGRLNVNRLNAPRVRPDDMRENLEALTTGVDEAARLLDLAQPEVIGFGCTSGSFLNGPGWDEEMRRRIAAAARTPRVVVTARAVVEALQALGAKRIAVATPYPDSVNVLLKAYLGHFGFEITGFEAVDGWKAGGIANLPPEAAADLVRRSDSPRADAVFVSCTNFRAGEIIDALEAQAGKPVVTANQATFWACALALDVDTCCVPGRLGRLRP
jgi:maleate cis-trans isomerase